MSEVYIPNVRCLRAEEYDVHARGVGVNPVLRGLLPGGRVWESRSGKGLL